MKSILISIKPRFVAKILNGEKTIEIRKTMPKCDLPIQVYIYCTKGKPLMYCSDKRWHWHIKEIKNFQYDTRFNYYAGFNGKVVAKFTLNKVEEITYDSTYTTFQLNRVSQNSCLKEKELFDYLKGKVGYAWHISDLEIFGRPKELSEFYGTKQYFICCESGTDKTPRYAQLAKAPQSWCYVEVE